MPLLAVASTEASLPGVSAAPQPQLPPVKSFVVSRDLPAPIPVATAVPSSASASSAQGAAPVAAEAARATAGTDAKEIPVLTVKTPKDQTRTKQTWL